MNVSIHFHAYDPAQVTAQWNDLIYRKENTPIDPKPVVNPDEVELGDEFDSLGASGLNMTVKEALAQPDKFAALGAIFAADMRFIQAASRKEFTDKLNVQNEQALAWLFQTTIGVTLEELEFWPDNAVAGIPLDMWVQMFKAITPKAMETLQGKAKKGNYSFDKFKAFLLGIKDVVKFCLDNHSEFIAYYDAAPTGHMRVRATQMYKRLAPEKAEATPPSHEQFKI